MKLAVVASGWHFPSQFYECMPTQILPKERETDLFVIAHRDPKHAKIEKKGKTFIGDRAYLDERLYPSVISKTDIKKLGWNYVEEPNTVGDWGNSNQWLSKHDYKDYDLLLFTHDDNLILSSDWFKDIIEDESYENWGILANTLGMPKGTIRGSCEFFKPWVIEKMGGMFDLSEVSLTREGVTTASEDLTELYDWNNMLDPIMKFIRENNIPLGFLSPSYRVSGYVIEGERGYISNTHGANTAVEDEGLALIKKYGLI